MTERVLYLFICGAGAARRVADLVESAQAEGWSVYCIATSSAVEYFLDISELEKLTGHRVRTTHRKLGEEPLPRADGVIVAPATYNTINKWAAGIADNYVLSQLAELTGSRVKIVVLPFVNSALANNPVFLRNIEELRRSGVRILLGPGEFEPHPPRTGGKALESYPWNLALDIVT